MNKKNNK